MKMHLIKDNLLIPTPKNVLEQIEDKNIFTTIELCVVPMKNSMIILLDCNFYVTEVIYSICGATYLLGVQNISELNSDA